MDPRADASRSKRRRTGKLVAGRRRLSSQPKALAAQLRGAPPYSEADLPAGEDEGERLCAIPDSSQHILHAEKFYGEVTGTEDSHLGVSSHSCGSHERTVCAESAAVVDVSMDHSWETQDVTSKSEQMDLSEFHVSCPRAS